MVFFGDKLVTWNKRSPEDAIPNVREAIEQYYDGTKRKKYRHLEDGESNWESWNLAVSYASKSTFANILDFLVNLPSLREKLEQEEQVRQWYWESFDEATLLTEKFRYKEKVPEILLQRLGIENEVLGGWMLEQEFERLDEDTTSSRSTYLFETASMYVYFDYYQTTIH